MSRSSARFVAYDLRPSKQAERRIILDILRIARSAGINVSSYPYIGMGGKRFYDFSMMHKYLGVRSMISIEHDEEILERCEFNKPLGFITILHTTSSDFIDRHRFERPVVMWLDYDWGLSKVITSDIFALATKLPVGSFLFVTVRAALPRPLLRLTADQKIRHYKDELGDLALDCRPQDVGQDGHSHYVEKVLNGAFQTAFGAKTEAKFHNLLRMLYRDTTWMATVGGCFCGDEMASMLVNQVKGEFPFLYNMDGPYELPDFNLTPKEMVLLDHIVTSNPAGKTSTALLKKLRFEPATIEAYRSVIRFLPKYVETFM